MYCVNLFIVDRVARVAHLHRAHTRVATGLSHSTAQNPVFKTSPKKIKIFI
jgi:hypothetical protein